MHSQEAAASTTAVAARQQQRPESPPQNDDDDDERRQCSSDDMRSTSPIRPNDASEPHRRRRYPIVLVGSSNKNIAIGRGNQASVRIGRRNRQVSRIHARIEFQAHMRMYELQVLGLNGAILDNKAVRQHERVLLRDDARIDILGTELAFIYPPDQEPPPSCIAPSSPPADGNKADAQPRSPSPSSSSSSSPPPGPASPAAAQEKENMDHVHQIIRTLVFSRKSSMSPSDICARIAAGRRAATEHDMERIQTALQSEPFFGEIVRKGKTADGSPKENLYYYNSEADPVDWRRAEYTRVGRSARKCTLQDKQYFWRIPKLARSSSHHTSPHSTATKSRT